jgi:hypothetical protein
MVSSFSFFKYEESSILIYQMGLGVLLCMGQVCPIWELAVAWDLREGLAPQEAGKISSQCSARAETTWTRTRKDEQVGRDEEGSA